MSGPSCALYPPPPPFRPLLSPEPGARSGPTALPPLSAASFSSSTTTRSPRNTAALAPALLSSLLHRPRLLRSIRFYRDVALLAYACISILHIVVTRIIIIFECFDARVLTTLREKIREIREIRSQQISCNPVFVMYLCTLHVGTNDTILIYSLSKLLKASFKRRINS